MSRARPLPPDERRAAIVAAARPLFIEGASFTTRQVAEAAGIAEGTIFRVFPTKDALVAAVLDDALDPSGTCSHLEAIPSDIGLDEAVTRAMLVLQDAVRDSSAVFAAFHRRAMAPSEGTSVHPPPPEPHDARTRADRLLASMVGVLAPHRDDLAIPIDQAASLIRSAALASVHPFFADGRIGDATTVAHVLLHGMTSPSTVTPQGVPDTPDDPAHPDHLSSQEDR